MVRLERYLLTWRIEYGICTNIYSYWNFNWNNFVFKTYIQEGLIIMTRDEEIRNAIDTIIPIPPSGNGRTYEQALMATGFEAGVKWADSNTKSHWISVKNDLPCNHNELINGNVTHPVFARDINNIYGVTIMMKFIKWDFMSCNITHWMPIPKLPKE